MDLELANRALEALRGEADSLLERDGYPPLARRLSCFADVRYVGQNTTLNLQVPEPPLDHSKLGDLAERFAQLHEATFGYRSDEESVQFVTLKAISRGTASKPRLPEQIGIETNPNPPSSRRAWYGDAHGWLDTAVIGRSDLTATPRSGPLIIEEYDSTTVVRPGWGAVVDGWNNVILER